jgi:hypothetical protein
MVRLVCALELSRHRDPVSRPPFIGSYRPSTLESVSMTTAPLDRVRPRATISRARARKSSSQVRADLPRLAAGNSADS